MSSRARERRRVAPGVYREEDGTFRLVIELPRGPDGKRKRHWVTFEGTRAQAVKERARLVAEAASGGVSPTKLTVGAYLTQWLEHVRSSGRLRRRSLEFYEEAVRLHIVPALGALRLDQLRPIHVQNYLKEKLAHGSVRGGGGLSPTTVRHHRAVLRTAFRQAVRWGLIPRDPTDGVEPPKASEYEPNVLSLPAVTRLLDAAAGTWWELPVLLTLATGLRRGELLGLTWDDVDDAAGTLTVRYQRTDHGLEPPKARASRRTVSLPPVVLEALRRERQRQERRKAQLGDVWQGAGFVICREDGSSPLPNTFTVAWKAFATEAGFPALRFHDLRHTAATLALVSGNGDVRTVAGRLGHADPTMTLRTYAHFVQSADRALAHRLDGFLRRSG